MKTLRLSDENYDRLLKALRAAEENADALANEDGWSDETRERIRQEGRDAAALADLLEVLCQS